LRRRTRSEKAPEATWRRLAADAATPSMSPISEVRRPRTLARKSGRTLTTISVEMSVRKLVALAAHTLRGIRRRALS
jgi:hypothetical protein